MRSSVSLAVLACCSVLAEENLILLNSDEIDYVGDLLKCRGNVKVVYGQKVLSADEVIYSKSKNNIRADGNVVIEDEKSNLFLLDYADIYSDFTSGSLRDLKIILADKSRIAAQNATLEDGTYHLQNVVYTSCTDEVCNNELTWKIKSRDVHFEPSDTTTYKDAYFNILGEDVLYLPYFSHVSNSLDRKSGFLTPKIATSGGAGFSLNIPYLWSISSSQELIFKPILTTKLGIAPWIQYKNRFSNGLFELSGSITDTRSVRNFESSRAEEQRNIEKIRRSGYRGHLNSKMTYLISSRTLFSYDIKLTSDDYYLKRFPFFYWSDRATTSQAALEHYNYLNYFAVKSYYFTKSEVENLPIVTPMIENNMRFDLFSGTLNFDTVLMNLSFHNSTHAQKVISRAGWSKKLLLPLGMLVKFSGLAAMNVLHVSEKERTNYDSFFSIRPQLNVMLEWPFVGRGEEYRCIFSPLVGVIISDNKKDTDIFEEPFYELSTSNLFEGTRTISSYTLDSGSRIMYGGRFAFYKLDRYLGNFTIGRSLEMTHLDEVTETTLKNKLSNIVASFDVVVNSNINFIGKASYSTHHNAWAKVETGLRVSQEKYYFDFLAFKGDQSKLSDHFKTGSINDQKYRGFVFNGTFQMNKKWSLKLGLTFGNDDAKLIKHNIGLKYKNECSSIETVFERTNYRGGDLKPNNSVKLVIHLKNLGI